MKCCLETMAVLQSHENFVLPTVTGSGPRALENCPEGYRLSTATCNGRSLWCEQNPSQEAPNPADKPAN
jgi:hypothetical protein